MKPICFEKIEEGRLRRIIDDTTSHRHAYSNFYGIDLRDVEILALEDDLFLLKKFDNFYRLYVMADSSEALVGVLRMVPQNTVINIPSKTGIEKWNEIFELANYRPIARYHRYFYINYKKGNDKRLEFANTNDTDIIHKQLEYFFSPITGHLPSYSDLEKMIENKTILINRNEQGEVSGAMSCQIFGKKADLTFWYDHGGNGLSLLYNVFFLCHQKEVRTITFWVNEENVDTANIHELLGAKRDGLVDYIFGNN